MNRGLGRIDPPCGLTGSALQQHTAPSKPNRLRRSFRPTQQTQTGPEESPKSQQPEFKSPTRIPWRSRAAGGFSGESPHNDSDFQQDIIWDATSPSPNRLGKRGKKHRAAGAVDISDIVNRIAPKHGRPEVAEPTLQQWIGDSATIPCTPDVQAPKKKSPRPNGVDDLLKLAKQFDFNMFHQEEEEEEGDVHQQSLELLSEDVLDLEDGDQINFSPSLPGNCQPAAKAATAAAAARTDEQLLHLDQHMEDDLDFLFDGPTQHVSGNLSQASSAQPSQVKRAASSSHGSSSPGVATMDAKGVSAKDEFEDDWENDDLLNDSLVLEMTQNPQKFTAPKHSSTQKPASQMKPQRSPAKDGVRQRTTFKLEPHPTFSVKRIQTDSRSNSKVDHGSEKVAQQNRFPSCHGVSVEAGPQRPWRPPSTAKSDPQERTSVTKHATTASNSSATKTTTVPIKPAAAAVSDLLDEDLSSFFLSDPVWDDPADDDLLCEMCDDLENQIQSAENVPPKRTPPPPPAGLGANQQRAALQPSNRNQQPDNRQTFPPNKQPPSSLPCAAGRPAGSSLAGGFVSNAAAGVQRTDSFRCTQTKNTSAAQGNTRKDQFTFKKPNYPVSTVTSKVLGKCSAAEIELKKQQAMERRRQRLQAAGNLRPAPT